MKAYEVLNLLRISRPTLTKYVKERIIKTTILPDGCYDYDVDSVYHLLNKDVKRKPKMNETVQRVEKHLIKKQDPFFPMLMEFCHHSKNLYNHANYFIKQEYRVNGKWLRYQELDKRLKVDMKFPDYKEMPTAQSAQQTLKLLDKNWKSFYASMRDFKKHPEKYLGRPRPPKYLKKDGVYTLVLTNQNCKFDGEMIYFPKVFHGFTLKPMFVKNEKFVTFNQVRLIPHKDRIVLEVIYSVLPMPMKEENQRYVGIDLGVNNLATVANTIGKEAFLINGKPLKAINQFYNKKNSHYSKVCQCMNDKDYSSRRNRLTEKRNAKINDYMHKASKYIVNWCVNHDISAIIIGKNREWKQEVSMGKKNNQTFVQIPFARLIEMIQYKARDYGIAVITTEESYTSGTSFIDNEEPTKEQYNKARRVYRGLFKANNQTQINADLNGAYQIVK